MPKGGYKIINLKGESLSNVKSAKIEGIFESIESSYMKAILLTNFSLYNIEVNAMWINFRPFDGNYVGVGVPGGSGNVVTKIVITPEDVAYSLPLTADVPSNMPSEEDGPSASI